MEDSYLTVAEIAQLLKLNEQTIRNWIDAGKLPAMRVGRRVRVKGSDFDRLVEGSYIRTAKEASSVETPSIWDGQIPSPVVPEDAS
jgi:excisionase family DNA binding protein